MAWGDEAYTHILLILPLSGALIYLERRTLPSVSRPAISAGLVLLVLALSLGGFAWLEASAWPEDMRLSLSMFALVTWWIGSVVLCFGLQTFQAFLFPLCFLFWLVPMPAIALDEIIHFLQHQSAFAARVLFMAAGVPVAQDGIMLSIPGLDIEVARECSSIRSSLMLIVTTMVLAHLFLRSGWRKALLIAAAVPLAAVKNGLRIFTIAELGTRVDPGIFDSNFHHRGGILFFAVSVAMTVGLLWVLRRTENTEPRGLEAR
jgi:exosortase